MQTIICSTKDIAKWKLEAAIDTLIDVQNKLSLNDEDRGLLDDMLTELEDKLAEYKTVDI